MKTYCIYLITALTVISVLPASSKTKWYKMKQVNIKALAPKLGDTNRAGIYLTYNDFKKDVLSHTVLLTVKENKVKFLPLRKKVKVITSDTTLVFELGSIYGYVYEGDVYRYSPNTELLSPEDYYKIEETVSDTVNAFVIYTSVFNGGNELFYSKGLNSKIHRLNLKNLKKDFGDINPEFIKCAKKINASLEGFELKDSKGHYVILSLYQHHCP